MDTRKLTDIFRATIDPSQRVQAEEQLEQVCNSAWPTAIIMKKIIGFAPSLLQLIMMSDIDMPIRQAGAIYLKNLTTQHWSEKEGMDSPGFALQYTLHEQDRAMIRDSIVDALVHAPELLQYVEHLWKLNYVLPLDLVTREIFSQWMEIVRQVADRPVPAHTNSIDEEERPDLPWWKCKKWALHILNRMFERISHGHSWKFLKAHMFPIIQDVIFPLLSYSQADEEMWSSDPREYIRVKFDIFEDFISPVTAAATLLLSACKKRKGMLQRTMNLVMQVLTSGADPRQRDGALHMVGTLAEILFKKKPYKEQMEQMLVQYVFPEYASPHGHMRARACWVMHYYNEMKFRSEENLANAVRLTTNALLTDTDLPVRVEAAIALHSLADQEKVEPMLESQIKPITLELLSIIRQTENDELTTVMQKFVCTYAEQIGPIAAEICQHLAATFSMVLETDEGTDEKAITAMGLLNTIETLISVMEDQPEIIAAIQPTVLQVIGHIFTHGVMEFYEEAFSLVYDLTTKSISHDMWKVFELIYQQKSLFHYIYK
uniref:Importin N-terminal domain-containing protein n=1 Tax=Rhodnius prolixus TaxID=13249 RepID=T1HBP5_RHOPR